MSDISAILYFSGFCGLVLWVALLRQQKHSKDIEEERRRLYNENLRDQDFSHRAISLNDNETNQPQKKFETKQDAKITIKQKTSNDIQLIRLPTQILGLYSTTGKFYDSKPYSSTVYEVDLDKQICTCPNFNERLLFPRDHMGRICEHLFAEMNKQKAFASLHHMLYTTIVLGLREKTRSAFALKQAQLPLMYIIIGDNDEWANVYARSRLSNQSIYEASGDFERHGWNLYERRWSYGTGPSGVSLMRSFFNALSCIEDLDNFSEDFVPEKYNLKEWQKLSEISDPRKSTDPSATQFGPESDAWEIPQSIKTKVVPLATSLNFRYIDSKGQVSRRTVDIHEIQYYGTEGEFIYGECRMRRAGRTFKTSRMHDVINVDTGEIIDEVTQYLQETYDESAIGKMRVWMQANDKLARAWLYLLKGNKTASATEYNVLKRAFSDILGGQEVATKDIKNLYDQIDPPTAVGFQRLVGGIKKNHSESALMFCEVCEKIVGARSKPNFADQAALNFVIKKMKGAE